MAWEALGKTEQYEVVIDAIANCIDTVSAGHEQVRGSSSSPAPVASFTSWSWAKSVRDEGVIAAHKEVALLQAHVSHTTRLTLQLSQTRP